MSTRSSYSTAVAQLKAAKSAGPRAEALADQLPSMGEETYQIARLAAELSAEYDTAPQKAHLSAAEKYKSLAQRQQDAARLKDAAMELAQGLAMVEVGPGERVDTESIQLLRKIAAEASRAEKGFAAADEHNRRVRRR